MHIKDIEVGKTYRYAIGTVEGEIQTGTVTVEDIEGGHGFPISGPSTLDGTPEYDGGVGLFAIHELIGEVI